MKELTITVVPGLAVDELVGEDGLLVLERVVLALLELRVGEDDVGLVEGRDRAVEVVAELLQGRVVRHLVGGARQLSAPRATRWHHPHVLRRTK